MSWIRKVYLYLVALISLIIIVVGCIQLIDLGLKQWVFTKADRDYYYYPVSVLDCSTLAETERAKMPECTNPDFYAKQEQQQRDSRDAQKQRQASTALAMIVVGSPVFYFHFKLARQEN